MWHVVVSPAVARAVGQHAESRDVLLAVLNRLHDLLRTHPEQFSATRDPADPDTSFLYSHSLYVGGRWRTFVFAVCDTRAPGYLFVEGLAVQ